jgi:hypothetical protein
MHVRLRLMNFFAGTMMLPDGTRSARLLDKLMGVLGAYYNANSIAASDTVTNLKLKDLILVSIQYNTVVAHLTHTLQFILINYLLLCAFFFKRNMNSSHLCGYMIS